MAAVRVGEAGAFTAPHHCLAPAAAVDGGGHGVGSRTGCAVHIRFWQDPQIVVAVASDLATCCSSMSACRHRCLALLVIIAWICGLGSPCRYMVSDARRIIGLM